MPGAAQSALSACTGAPLASDTRTTQTWSSARSPHAVSDFTTRESAAMGAGSSLVLAAATAATPQGVPSLQTRHRRGARVVSRRFMPPASLLTRTFSLALPFAASHTLSTGGVRRTALMPQPPRRLGESEVARSETLSLPPTRLALPHAPLLLLKGPLACLPKVLWRCSSAPQLSGGAQRRPQRRLRRPLWSRWPAHATLRGLAAPPRSPLWQQCLRQ